MEHALEEPLRLAVANLHAQRQAPRELQHAMVEQRHAGFEAHRHRGTVDLRQDIVRQVGQRIGVHHAVEDVVAREAGVERFAQRAETESLTGSRHEIVCVIVQQRASRIALTRRSCGQVQRQPARLPATRRDTSAPRVRATAERKRAACQTRHTTEHAPRLLRAPIARIAAKQLVAAIARETHGNVPARELRNQMRRNRRAVAERLVVHRSELRDDVHRFPRRHIQFRVLGAEPLRDSPRVIGLVIFGFEEADRERAYRSRGLCLQQRHDDSGVNTAGKKCTERHVRQALLGDRPLQCRFERIGSGFVVCFERRGKTPLGNLAQ